MRLGQQRQVPNQSGGRRRRTAAQDSQHPDPISSPDHPHITAHAQRPRQIWIAGHRNGRDGRRVSATGAGRRIRMSLRPCHLLQQLLSDRRLFEVLEMGALIDAMTHVRDAFTIGAYYPALTGAAALGERIINHLMIGFGMTTSGLLSTRRSTTRIHSGSGRPRLMCSKHGSYCSPMLWLTSESSICFAIEKPSTSIRTSTLMIEILH